MFLTEEDVNKVIRTVREITPEDAVLTYMKQYFRDKYDICFHESSDTERKIRQRQKFKKIYKDAFAGTGEIETRDGEQCLVGSAKRALSSEKKFDHYYFIEADLQKAEELQNMINTEFSQMRRIVTIYCGDANEKLADIIRNVDWRYNRGLLFLDPYATQVNWTSHFNLSHLVVFIWTYLCIVTKDSFAPQLYQSNSIICCYVFAFNK